MPPPQHFGEVSDNGKAENPQLSHTTGMSQRLRGLYTK